MHFVIFIGYRITCMSHPAYLLISHGSRDPRPDAAMAKLAQQLAQQLAQRLATSDLALASRASCGGGQGDRPARSASAIPLVETAVLELHPLPLHQQILRVSEHAIARQHDEVRLVPIFLLPGVHVKEDIPAEVAIARQQLTESLPITVYPHLGSHPHVSRLLMPPADAPTTAARLVISHGSRRPGGNEALEQLAATLGASVAFWSVPPSIEDQLAKLVQAGHRAIALMPFMLFPGGILDGIAQQVETLVQQHPQVTVYWAPPMGAAPALIDLLADWLA